MEGTMRQNFVVFFSPGTLVAEQSTKLINSWDIDKAIELSKDIKERYGALPYGFCFTTKERKDDELDSREVKRSSMYFLGGDTLTLEDIKRRNDPKDSILISNMEGNKWYKIVVNNNSWQWTQPLKKGDVVLTV